jgi:hypothetical protein
VVEKSGFIWPNRQAARPEMAWAHGGPQHVSVALQSPSNAAFHTEKQDVTRSQEHARGSADLVMAFLCAINDQRKG